MTERGEQAAQHAVEETSDRLSDRSSPPPEAPPDHPGGRPAGSDRETEGWSVARVRRARPPLAATLRWLWPQLGIAAAVFTVGALAGYLVADPAMLSGASEAPVAPDTSAVGFFLNNTGVAVVLMGGFALLTVPVLASNGATLGAIVKLTLVTEVPADAVAWRLLPHGVVEIPALVVAAAVGLLLPWRVLASVTGRRERIATPTDERHLLQTMAVVVAALLVAAVVEAHLTEPIAGALAGDLPRQFR
jgi:stage II sporulation protein M